MGRAVGRGADVAIVTNDNPRPKMRPASRTASSSGFAAHRSNRSAPTISRTVRAGTSSSSTDRRRSASRSPWQLPAMSSSSPGRGTRTLKSSARKSATSTIVKKRVGPLRCGARRAKRGAEWPPPSRRTRPASPRVRSSKRLAERSCVGATCRRAGSRPTAAPSSRGARSWHFAVRPATDTRTSTGPWHAELDSSSSSGGARRSDSRRRRHRGRRHAPRLGRSRASVPSPMARRASGDEQRSCHCDHRQRREDDDEGALRLHPRRRRRLPCDGGEPQQSNRPPRDGVLRRRGAPLRRSRSGHERARRDRRARAHRRARRGRRDEHRGRPRGRRRGCSCRRRAREGGALRRAGPEWSRHRESTSTTSPPSSRRPRRSGARNVVGFGRGAAARYRIDACESRGGGGAHVVIVRDVDRIAVDLPILGEAAALDFAAALAAADAALGAPISLDILSRIQFRAVAGRGAVRLLGRDVLLVDDTYNANPASVRNALAGLAEIEDVVESRRTVAILGEMRELGATSEAEHAAVGDAVVAAGVSLVIGSGGLVDLTLERAAKGGIATIRGSSTSDAARHAVAEIRPHDVVLVKGSRGVALECIVDEIVRAVGVAGGAR